VNHDIPHPPIDLFYDTLEEALDAIQELHRNTDMPLPSERMERSTGCICNVIVADLVHLVYRSRTGGESGVQDALIVPSLGY
jgi:hypothetical protein